jgi:iron complex transport system substrate-binding protein
VRRRLLLVAAALVVATGAAAPSFAAPPAPVQRVASLNLAADEILVEILPPGRLVGVTRWVDDPTSSLAVGRIPPDVVRFPRAELERLVALHPDLVVVSEYSEADFLHQLETSGLRWHRMEGLTSLPAIRAAIRALGDAVGEPLATQKLLARYDERLNTLAARLAGAPRPRVLYWGNPHTAGADTAYGAIIECGGGENVARTLGLTGMVPLGAERAFTTDPDYLLIGESFESKEALEQHPLLGKLRAVREGKVISMPSARLVTLSQHVADSCWYLASRLHPDRVAGTR